ncbi:RecA protein [Cutibacterium acnes JCM 18916]|nr:RecA protein [Cutibacterium acnes JCM 18916]
MAATADREKALATALQQIEKQHGKGSIMRLGEQETVKIAAIPTGSVALDVALGVGGSHVAESWRSMVPNPPARRRWLCTQSLMPS